MKTLNTQLDFMSLQVKDMERSKTFYSEKLGFALSEYTNPEAIVFQNDGGAIFAIRKPFVDLSQFDALGAGVSIWFGWKKDIEKTHEELKNNDVPIVKQPFDTPFGKALICKDPDGYLITLHEVN